MKMLGITIGVGEGWKQCAIRTARRMRQMTGVECMVIDQAPGWVHPSWAKCRLWDVVHDDVTHVLYFDADILPLKPWRPQTVNPDAFFTACRDVESDAVFDECFTYGIRPHRYFNGGLFVASRGARSNMEYAATFHPQYGKWLEQTPLNKALSSCAEFLDRRYNTLLWPGQDDYSADALRSRPEINLHASSLGGDWQALWKIQDAAAI